MKFRRIRPVFKISIYVITHLSEQMKEITEALLYLNYISHIFSPQSDTNVSFIKTATVYAMNKCC